MKKCILFVLLVSAASMSLACSEEGYIKVFKCNPTYPYFNVADNHCYTSEEAAAQANEKADSDAGGSDAAEETESKTDQSAGETDQTSEKNDQSGSETDKTGNETDQSPEETDQFGSETDEPGENSGEGA